MLDVKYVPNGPHCLRRIISYWLRQSHRHELYSPWNRTGFGSESEEEEVPESDDLRV